MPAEENKAIARRLMTEVMNEGKLEVADELLAADWVDHDPANPPGSASGPDAFKQLATMYRAAFPDMKMTIEDMIAEGDRVVTRWTARGTHQGELMGAPPSGKQVTVTGIGIDRIAGGKIAESWGNWDTLGLLTQVGAIPEPARA
jgi:steroid delta-isomerase-like uncharacterized protein